MHTKQFVVRVLSCHLLTRTAEYISIRTNFSLSPNWLHFLCWHAVYPTAAVKRRLQLKLNWYIKTVLFQIYFGLSYMWNETEKTTNHFQNVLELFQSCFRPLMIMMIQRFNSILCYEFSSSRWDRHIPAIPAWIIFCF